ncbi:MAG: cupin domain-containing protein [Victivallaceae bacterium]|nr:cupin domain-containing protein [Victivallaceae bacterium]
MIRKAGEYRKEVRNEMRGGKGSIKVEHYWEPGTEMRSKNRMFAKLTIEPGCSIGPHPHDSEDEIFVILSGTAEVNDNGEAVKLTAGDSMLTGNGDFHAIRNIGDDTLEVLAVVSNY